MVLDGGLLLGSTQVGVEHCTIRLDLLGAAGREDRSVVEHVHRRADLHDERHVVLHQQHGHAFVGERAQQPRERRRLALVLPGGRLVEEHLVATSDGKASATAGTTTVGDVTVLGMPATIDATGVHLTAPADNGASGPASTTAPTNPLLGQLGPLLQPVAQGLSALLRTTLGSVNVGVNALLNQGGIDIRTIPVTETKNGAEASRLAGGLSIQLHYDGKTEPVMSQILALIPVAQLPSQGLGPVPFSSPQALVLLPQATHIIDVGMAAANVHVSAAPPFDLPSSNATGDAGASGGNSDVGAPSTGSTGGSGGGSFGTPIPAIPAAHRSGGGSTVATANPAAFHGAAPLAAVAGILLALLIDLAFGAGSRRMADDVLAEGAGSCPEGLDRPPPPWSPT